MTNSESLAPTGPDVPANPAKGTTTSQFHQQEITVGTTLLDRYTLVKRIARSAMSAVYVAEQHALERQVAVKVLLPSTSTEGQMSVLRFQREARALARIHHPNVVGLIDHFTANNHTFLVMEYIEAQTLWQMARAEGINTVTAIEVAIQLCRALTELHTHRIIHRDIKHSNVFVERDVAGELIVRLVDFGIIKDDLDQNCITRPDMIVGTPRFMAPEQALGEPVTPATDLYSLGSLLYWMLLGRAPFQNHRGTQALVAQINEPPPPFARVRADVTFPPVLEWTVMRCLEKRPADRFRSAEDLRAALRVCRLALVRPDLPIRLALQDGEVVATPAIAARVAAMNV